MNNKRDSESDVGIDRSQEQVAVMFSGGTDSMLAAATGAETFKKVHLVTFHTSQMSHWERSCIGAQALIDRYGTDKVVHRIIDNDALFRNLHFSNYFKDLKKYGLYLTCLVCPACGVGFQVRSLVYCRKYGCRYLWDGLQDEGASEHIYPGLHPDVQGRITELCRDHGVIRESPVYDISRTDYVLYEKGLTDRRGLKLRALLDADMKTEEYKEQLNLWHRTQADCTGNVVGLMYLIGAFLPRYGHEANKELMGSYFEERIEMGRAFLERHFAGEPVPFLDIPEDSAGMVHSCSDALS
jgi:7-cyano-7-deazaguanine synthase in queuosine biosynthesis